MNNYDYSQPYVTRDEYLEVKGIDLNIELQDDDNQSNKVNRFIQDLTNFVLDHLVMDYGCNELNRQLNEFEDLAEFRRVRFHYGMLDQIEYVLNNGLIHVDSGINRETGSIIDFSGVVIGPAALKQFRLGGFCNKQEGRKYSTELSPREYTIGELVLALANKVDKVDGKGLSTNDFTNAYMMLIDSLNREINNKVDKVIGKVLSDNNFTNALLQKLNGIETQAQVNKIEEIRVNNEPVTISGKVVNLTTFAHDDTKEDVANKVTSISSESTDAQYPTAKCVYNNMQTVLEVALGATKAFSVDPTSTGNTGFQSNDAVITVTSFVDVNGNEVDVTTLKKGDLVFTLNGVSTKYADRWLIDPATGAWGLIDADSPSLEGYVTTDTAQTISGEKTFSSVIKQNLGIQINDNSDFDIKDRSGVSIYRFTTNMLRPMSDGIRDLGLYYLRWRDGHFSGTIYTANLDFSGVINPNANGYGFIVPSSAGLTANKRLATEDEAFNVINASDIVNNTLTQEQLDLLKNGKETRIIGDLRGVNNPILYYWQTQSNYDFFMYYGGGSFGYFYCYTDRVITRGPDNTKQIALRSIRFINGKDIDYYLNNVYPYASNATTELAFETINNIELSANKTFTLATAPANTYPEYKGNIENTSNANTVTLTFTGVDVIKCNNPSIVIYANTLDLPPETTIEFSIQNGKMVAVDWDYE